MLAYGQMHYGIFTGFKFTLRSALAPLGTLESDRTANSMLFGRNRKGGGSYLSELQLQLLLYF